MSTESGLTQVYAGRSGYVSDYVIGPDTLLVAVPCYLDGQEPEVYALLDTASHWSVLPGWLAEELGFRGSAEAGDQMLVRIRTSRSGIITGRIGSLWVRLPAVEGENLDLQVTCVVSEEWTGPLVLGWKGCLEGIRIGLDPGTDSFYFGDL